MNVEIGAARPVRVEGCAEAAVVQVGIYTLLYVVARGTARVESAAVGPVDGVVRVAAIPRTSAGAVDAAALLATPIVDGVLEAHVSEALAGTAECAVVTRDVERPLPFFHPTQLVKRPRARPTAARDVTVLSGVDAASGPPAFSDGGEPPQGPPTLPEILRRAAAGSGVTTYLDGEGATTVPHAALLDAAERVAGGLRARGVGAGDAVLVAVSDAQEILTAFWGAVLIGAIPAIVSVPRSLAESSSALDVLVRAYALLDRPLVIGEPALRDVLDHPQARLSSSAELREGPRLAEHHAPHPDEVALYNLTSGSTGQPKCIELTHRGLLARARGTQLAMRFGADDRILSWLPFDHIGSISDWHIRPLDAGSALFYATKERVIGAPLSWLDLMSEHQITSSWAPNFAFQLVLSELARAQPDARWDLSCVDCLLTAGESVSRQTVADFAEALAPHGLAPHTVVPAFGMAELGSGVSYARPMRGQLAAFHELDGASFADLGPPIPGAKLRVVDAEGQVLRERAVGQVQIGGAVVARGYRNASAEQRAAFLPDGWLDTGDRGFLADGRLVLTGRSKDVIIVNGSNYYAHEIEAVVESEAGVESSFAAAFAVHVPDERLAIVYTSSLPVAAHARQVRAIRRAVVARIGINPELVLPVDRARIPKTAIGKIMRTRLRDAVAAGQLDGEIAAIEAAIGGPSAVPDWFATPAWGPAQRASDDPSSGPIVWVTGGLPAAHALAMRALPLFAEQDRRAFVVEHVAALQPLADAHGPLLVVSCAALGGAGVRDLVAAQLAAVPAAHRVVVLAGNGSPRDAAVAGWARALIAERGARLVTLDEATDPRELAAELMAAGDPEVRLAASVRALPRLEPIAWPATAQTPPVQAGRLYLVTGGSGGLGQGLATALSETWGAQVLRVARRATADTVAVDLNDARALEAAVAAAERAHGTLAGVFHLAGVYRETLARDETVEGMEPVLGPKLAGTDSVVRLLDSRPDAFFVAYSSLASIMGGAGLGAYSAANAYLDATAVALRRAGRAAWSIAWSAFSEVGLGRDAASSELLRARGYLGISPTRGLASLWAAMTRDAPVIAIGVDRTHPELRWRVIGTPLPTREVLAFVGAPRAEALVVPDRAGRPVEIEVRVVATLPRTDAGAIDVDALLGHERSVRTPPSGDTEQALASLWRDLLAVPEVMREDDFFGLGGHSLLATQLASRVRDRLGVTIPVGKLFEATTLADMAAVVEQLRAPDADDVSALLDQVRHLSPDELAKLLADDAVSGGEPAYAQGGGDEPGSSEVAARITTVGIITANRPTALERSADSYIENLRDHGRRVDVVVTDDSRDESTARDNAARLSALARKYDQPIYYGWIDAKRRYIERLTARSGAPQHVVHSAFLRGTSGVYACGVNRNSYQMAVAGEAAFLADDDTLCRITPAPHPRSGVGIGAHQDAAELWFFADREAALRGMPTVGADLLGLHEAYLGRSAGELAPDTTFRHPIAPATQARLTAASTRVGVTLCGLHGDVGWAVPFGQWGTPMGFLLLDDESRERLVASDETYRGAYASRQILRVVARPTITDASYSMSTFWAFDNRQVLPPHLVSMRGADLIFGAALWRTHPQMAFAHLPHALFHAPLERREFRVGEMIRSATGFDATRMFINLMRAAPEMSTQDPAERLRAIGRWLVEFAAQAAPDFWRSIADQGRRAELAFLELIDAQLERHGRAPRWWADDLGRYADALRRSIARDSWFHPLDVRANLASDEAADLLARQMVTELGEMMMWWPDLFAAALELRREGVRMVERLT